MTTITPTLSRRITLRCHGFFRLSLRCTYVRYLGTLTGAGAVRENRLRELWRTPDGVEFEMRQPDDAREFCQVVEVWLDAETAAAAGLRRRPVS